MQFPLRLNLRPSIRLTICLSLLHAAAISSLLPLDLAWTLKIVLAFVLTVSAWFSIRRYALLRDATSIRDLTFAADGTVQCLWNASATDTFACTVSAQSTALPWLVVILLKAPQWRRLRPVVVLPDALSADEFRALRIWLRWKANRANQPAAKDA